MNVTPDHKTIMNQLLIQLAGVTLTIVGLSFTITQPLFNKLDTLSQSVTELKTQANADSLRYEAFERRLNRIETDLYRLQNTQNADKK